MANPYIKQLKIELKHLLQNPAVFLVVVLAPIFYGLFYAYPYTHEVPRKVPVAVVDQDMTGLSRQFVQMVDAAENSAVAYAAVDFEDAKQAFYERKAYAVVIVPKGFERKLLRGEVSDLSLYTDGSYLIYYRQSFGAVQTAALTLGAGVAVQRLESKGVPEYAALDQRTTVQLNNYALFNPIGGYATYVLPAVFVLICHQLMLVGISMIMAEERIDICKGSECGDPFIRLVMKAAVYLGLIALQGLFLFGVALHLFDIPFNGHYMELILFLIPYYLSVVFIGIFIGSFMKLPELSIIYIAGTSIPLLFLSGVPWSKLAMPPLLQYLRLILPSSHGIEGFVRIFREGASLGDVMGHFIWLWIIAAVFLPLAYIRLKSLSKMAEKIK